MSISYNIIKESFGSSLLMFLSYFVGGVLAFRVDGGYMTKMCKTVGIFLFSLSIFLVGCSGGDGNNPPYAVTGPASAALRSDSGLDRYFTVETDAPGSELDPDGDYAFFNSGPLPPYLEIYDDQAGIFKYVSAPEESIDISVWIEDEHGLSSSAFTITLTFTPS